mmetsp:Transcript_29229/g.86473  ORF Transcript_29229/g.86473 Transcript_29229/m.86473 type:complete len:210 (-) Transcript_29229:794-1423(-)
MSFSNLSSRCTRVNALSASRLQPSDAVSASDAGALLSERASIVPMFRKPMAPTAESDADCVTADLRIARSTSSARTRNLVSPASSDSSSASMRATRIGIAAAALVSSLACCWTCEMSRACCAELSFRLSSSVAYGCATVLNWYSGSSVFPMPSSVLNARRTNVKFAGNRNGWSTAIEKRSSPMLAMVSLRSVWRERFSMKKPIERRSDS